MRYINSSARRVIPWEGSPTGLIKPEHREKSLHNRVCFARSSGPLRVVITRNLIQENSHARGEQIIWNKFPERFM